MRSSAALVFMFTALIATGTLSGTADAQTADCRSIVDSGARLACYDKAAPPASLATVSPARRPAPASKVDNGKYVDSISAEDAIMNERIKGICHGC